MKYFKKALAICAVALVLSSLSAVPTFAASADQNTDELQPAPSFRLPNGMTGQYKAVENELGGIDYVFPENVPEIRGNSKGITATPVIRPDLRTPTEDQVIPEEDVKTDKETKQALSAEAESDPMLAAALAADDCEIRYSKDGSVRIITATIPNELTFNHTSRPSITQLLNSQHQTYTADTADHKYDAWSTLYTRGTSGYDGGAYVTADTKLPAYTVGLAPRVYNANNQIISTGSTEFQFNTTAESNHHMAFTNTIAYPDGKLQAGGEMVIYNGTKYIYQSIPYTELTSVNSSSLEKADLTKGLTKDKKYPVNKKGETYGSELQAEIVGSKPDLIAAVGTKGENGYVRKSDINPVMKTPKEAAAYMKKTASGSHKIPLYNAEGKKIGEFQFDSGKQPTESEFQAELQSVTAQQELAEIRLNGYPVNKKGETYGPELEGVDEKPDLIAVSTSDGKSGYALKEDLLGQLPRTPEEAAEYMKNRPASRTIPVFDAEHEKQIGEFVIDGETSLSRAEMQQRLAESRNAEAKK